MEWAHHFSAPFLVVPSIQRLAGWCFWQPRQYHFDDSLTGMSGA
jgi:hypothetical protein